MTAYTGLDILAVLFMLGFFGMMAYEEIKEWWENMK